MRTFSEFQIIGRVGNIKQVGSTLRISLAADYGKKDKNGEYQSNPFWNEVTIFNENTITWANKTLGTGDLVHTRGTIRQTKYEKDGETHYGITLAAQDFDLLAKKKANGDDEVVD